MLLFPLKEKGGNMQHNNHIKTDSVGSLNTLAQKGTETDTPNMNKAAIIITGRGSDMGDIRVMKRKAKRKNISRVLAVNLLNIADAKKNPEKKKALWNTFHCQNKITSVDGRYYGKYCKNRFCTVCNSIRKAYIINKYQPILKEWKDAYFVTLTVKASCARDLKTLMEWVMKNFNRIIEKYRKRHLRGKGPKLMGVKSLECNFNVLTKTYNPHLHLIVPNEKFATILIKEWLEIWPPKSKMTYIGAQHYRRIYNLESALVEIIKYGSKTLLSNL